MKSGKEVINLHQYWFWIGSFPIRAYSTLFVLAFLLGLGVTVYLAKADKKQAYIPHLMNMAPLLFLGGVIGARIWQVFFFDWEFYRSHPSEIIAIWHGGLSIQGGIVGSFVAGGWYIWRHRLDFWLLVDLFAPGIFLGQSIGRDANLMNGDAFGSPTHGTYGILYPHTTLAYQTYGNQPLWPAEVWEGQADVILFALLLILKQRRWPRGFLFLFYVISYNLVRFGLEMLRGDSPRFLFHWDAAQWTSMPLVVLAALLMILRFVRERRNMHGQKES